MLPVNAARVGQFQPCQMLLENLMQRGKADEDSQVLASIVQNISSVDGCQDADILCGTHSSHFHQKPIHRFSVFEKLDVGQRGGA